MLFWTIIKVALKSLYASKLRSFLAMLGIIIGVGAVIAMLAMGAGAQQQVMQRIYSMGTDLLTVRPSQSGFGGARTGSEENLTLEDAEALVKVAGVNQVAPVVNGSAQVKYFNKNARVSIVGTSNTYFPIRNIEIERGRYFTQGEVEALAPVAVIGPATVSDLFSPGDDPLGVDVKVNGKNFKIIGVQKAKGDQGFYSPDDQLVVPYSVAMKQILGVDHLREIAVQGKRGVPLSSVQEATSTVLRTRHRLLPGRPDDFYIRNQAELVSMVTSVTRTFTILLGSIASISLLVGGIGIMNIMLVTVTERTREIGVRKAIGARERDILRQFLIEALLMSALGGLIGVGIGVGAARILAAATQFSTTVEPQSVVMALGFSGAVGVFFGYYPARRAAKLDPIEALRYE